MDSVWAAGLMSGTSLDGTIDVALIKTDGNRVEKFSKTKSFPYDKKIMEKIRECIITARDWNFIGVEPEIFRSTEEVITIAQSEAVKVFINAMDLESPGLVGFHGQTILHNPPRGSKHGSTLQLGNGNLMADILKIPVVYDFRSADMKVGGQGAPLCPSYHQALLSHLSHKAETAILNLGGIGNITYWDHQEGLIAFDTGPANAPINDYVTNKKLGDMDKDGLLASRGITNEKIVKNVLKDRYFSTVYPKSLDRHNLLLLDSVADLSTEDAIATLTSVCAETVAKAISILPKKPKNIIVCGGGRHNPVILREIRERTRVNVNIAEDFGWRGDAIEAECFGFLAVRSLYGLPISFPKTTGVPVPMSGGRICYP